MESQPASGRGYASIVVRFFAYILDNLFVSAVTFAMASLAISQNQVDLAALGPRQLARLALLVWAFQTAVSLCYFTIMIGGSGRTFGKAILGVEVVRTNGGRAGYGRALIRATGYYISAFFLYFGFLIALLDRRRQSLHDKMAGTVVVEID